MQPGTKSGTPQSAEYADLYRERNGQLVAYATSLTGSAWVAEDLVAEAHFRVWRRLRAGQPVENVAAYLTTTVRNLASGLGRAQREVTRDPSELPENREQAADVGAAPDPEQRASHTDLLTRLLKELPERWASALWYAEVEDLPLEEVGARIGASAGTAAVVLSRARERLRQAFLQTQPGEPVSAQCAQYWKTMPAIVREAARRTRRPSPPRRLRPCHHHPVRAVPLPHTDAELRYQFAVPVHQLVTLKHIRVPEEL